MNARKLLARSVLTGACALGGAAALSARPAAESPPLSPQEVHSEAAPEVEVLEAEVLLAPQVGNPKTACYAREGAREGAGASE
ncbi:MAG: hypothetical protein KF878_36700 [Planctomycetes bacterium]|nr:hypothetical protein [Planctomycetota bacterium]